MRWFIGLAAIATLACLVNKRSTDFTCEVTDDCTDPNRVCSDGFCLPLACPSQCNAGCDLDSQLCNIACDTPNSCPIVRCPAGFACAISCTKQSACGVIDCQDAASCSVTCTTGSACETIACGAGPCDVSCAATGSCGIVDCSSSCRCEVACNPGTCDAASCPTTGACSVADGCDPDPAGCTTCPGA